MPDSPSQHFAPTSQPEQAKSNPNQETALATSAKKTQANSAQVTPEPISEKSGGISKQDGKIKLFADPSYLLNLKY